MAVVRIPDENRSLHEVEQIQEFLAGIDIDYQHWEPEASVPQDASADQILSAYEKQINELKHCGGYVTADVIDVNQSRHIIRSGCKLTCEVFSFSLTILHKYRQ